MKTIKFMCAIVVFLLTITLFSISCKNNNSVKPNDPLTITWQQTAHDSVVIFDFELNQDNEVLAASGCSGDIVFLQADCSTPLTADPLLGDTVCISTTIHNSGAAISNQPVEITAHIQQGDGFGAGILSPAW